MKHVAIYLTLLLSSLTLAAQNEVTSQSQILVLRGNPVGSTCPISMHASQGVWDHSIKIRQGQREQTFQPFGQKISLALVDSHPSPIVDATVKVHGLTGKNHVVQTTGDGNTNGNGARTMRITFAANPLGGVSGDLYAPGFTSISSVELLEISYDDGMVWRIGGSSVCRVRPDPLMLIATH